VVWPEDLDILKIDGTAQWWLILPWAYRIACSKSKLKLLLSTFGRGNSASGEWNAGSRLAAVECKEPCASISIHSPTDYRRVQTYGESTLDVGNDVSSAECVTICQIALPLGKRQINKDVKR